MDWRSLGYRGSGAATEAAGADVVGADGGGGQQEEQQGKQQEEQQEELDYSSSSPSSSSSPPRLRRTRHALVLFAVPGDYSLALATAVAQSARSAGRWAQDIWAVVSNAVAYHTGTPAVAPCGERQLAEALLGPEVEVRLLENE